ncbi:MAG: hypothetical protein IJT01_01545 [Selenomonadaceae bacterium]|nr:hypothetical protein [Selenomonadaceae bacterium]
MVNVYGQVEKFYNEYMDAEHVLPMDIVERYLRKNAWHGSGDDDLKRLWDILRIALLYVMETKLYALEALIPGDYQEIAYRIAEERGTDTLDEQSVTGILDVFEDFYKYLQRIKYAELQEQLQEAKDSFYEDGHFLLPERHPAGEFYSVLEHLEEITPEDMDKLNDILDKLLQSIGEYFHQTGFLMDLTRAVALFGGPNYEHPDEQDKEAQDSFWFSFWDYFLFDYHLLQTDDTPLQYFYAHEKGKLDPTEKAIVRDLLKARFTVFYIEDMDGEYITCRDMFTDEVIELPAPDSFIPDYKRVILYGHIHARGVMLLNYITTVPASGRLRNRIKDEILRQLELFRYQRPDATREMFFARQAAAVRHTIHILTDFAQLKVVPMKDYPAPIVQTEGLHEKYAASEKRLGDAARKLGFSVHAVQMLIKFYADFLTRSTLSDTLKRRASVLTAVILMFCRINGMDLLSVKGSLEILGSNQEDVFQMAPNVQEATGCIPFDPRYMTEEGFVQSLFVQT